MKMIQRVDSKMKEINKILVLLRIVRNILSTNIIRRGGDTSMAGMAIAIPGVLNISKTGDTVGKIR